MLGNVWNCVKLYKIQFFQSLKRTEKNMNTLCFIEKCVFYVDPNRLWIKTAEKLYKHLSNITDISTHHTRTCSVALIHSLVRIEISECVSEWLSILSEIFIINSTIVITFSEKYYLNVPIDVFALFASELWYLTQNWSA